MTTQFKIITDMGVMHVDYNPAEFHEEGEGDVRIKSDSGKREIVGTRTEMQIGDVISQEVAEVALELLDETEVMGFLVKEHDLPRFTYAYPDMDIHYDPELGDV